MTTSNAFEFAARNKLRFASSRGLLTAEQLWDVPLRSKDDFNLDAVARAANAALKDATQGSFVAPAEQKPETTRLQVAMDIVLHVIAAKLDEEAAAKKRAENKAEKEKLLRILAQKQDGELEKLSVEDLRRRIEAL